MRRRMMACVASDKGEPYLRNTNNGYVDLGICSGWSGAFSGQVDLRINTPSTSGDECFVINSWGSTQFGLNFAANTTVVSAAARTNIDSAVPSTDCSTRSVITFSHYGSGALSPGLYAFNRGGYFVENYFLGDIWNIKLWDADGVLQGDFVPKNQGGIGFYNKVDGTFHIGTNQSSLEIGYS